MDSQPSVSDDTGAVYRLLKEDGPLSIDELTTRLAGCPPYGIEITISRDDRERVRQSVQKLVSESYLTHDTTFDSNGRIRWMVTVRPDLNPKPDGRNLAAEELRELRGT